jgi:hypothetical protein
LSFLELACRSSHSALALFCLKVTYLKVLAMSIPPAALILFTRPHKGQAEIGAVTRALLR